MRRRTVLGTVSGGVVALAGCSGRRTETGQPPETATPEPPDSDDCPPHEGGREATVCSRTADATASVALRPTPATAKAPERIELTLDNDSGTELRFNPNQGSVRRETDDGWWPIERRSSGDGRLVLDPGETRTWTLRAVVDTIDDGATLGSGTYTAGIGVPSPNGTGWIQCLALVRLRG